MRICAGGLLVRDDRMLLARRSETRMFYPGVWDVIGGHCEREETPADTQLSAFEEIAILPEPAPLVHGDARYHIFVVTAWNGEPRLQSAEHSELRWLSLDQAVALPLAHPAYPELFHVALEHRTGAPRR